MDALVPHSAMHEARVTIPRLSTGVVRRERVLALISDAATRPVALVTGGAGSGKTYAVADWVRSGGAPGPAVWVTLDGTDRDSHRLWTTVLLAARRTLVEDAPANLTVPTSPGEDFVAELFSELRRRPCVIVLDDLQEVEGGSSMESLALLVRTPPGDVPLLLLSRHDPPLPLHRLRLAGQLGELRAAELTFTRDEAARLLATHGVDLRASSLTRVLETTEGWAAGLRLAALALGAADEGDALARFDGRHSLVSGYLAEEVLRGIGADRAEFLLRTSVAGRMCAPLARAMTGEESAGAILASLVRDNILTVELDGGWYRYHPLLLQMLRARLTQERPALKAELERRAVAWLESAGEGLAALELAVEAGDWALAGRVALRSAAVAIFTSRRPELAATLGRIPPAAAHGDAELTLALALGAFCRSDDVTTATLLAAAERGLPAIPEPRLAVATLVLRVLEAARARRLGQPVAMVGAAADADRLARAVASADAPGWAPFRGTPGSLRAVGELWRGRPRRASELFTASLAAVDAGYGEVYVRGHVALAAAALGLTGQALADATLALAAARSNGSVRSHESGAAWLALATAALERADAAGLDSALAGAGQIQDQLLDPFVASGLLIITAYRELGRGDLVAARRTAGRVDTWLREYPGMIQVDRLRAALAVAVELASAAPGRAQAVLAAHEERARACEPADVDVVALARAHVMLVTGRAEAVRPLVCDLLPERTSWAARAWVLVALAEDRLRHDASALDAVARGVDAAAAAGALAPLLPLDGRHATLLRHHLDVTGTHGDLISRALTAGPGETPDPVGAAEPEQLTERERSILALLPMRTNSELAGELGISVNTVKQHLKSINRKLGVVSRRDAVRVTQRLALLHDQSVPGP